MNGFKKLSWALWASPFAFSGAASAQTAHWIVEQAVANGTGCIMGSDTLAIAAGDQIQFIFSNLGVDLPANSGLPFAARKACTVAVPAQIARGYYAANLQQSLYYGGIKSAGATASIATQGTFFGLPVNPLVVNLPYGSTFNQPAAYRQTTNSFLVSAPGPAMWCLPAFNPVGLFTSRLVVQGSKSSDNQNLLLSADQYDIKFYATMGWLTCPAR
ncbi:MAG: hypothetical protein RIR26_1000 [Pseudomonadota bacterium]|jgi:hypothetical protein